MASVPRQFARFAPARKKGTRNVRIRISDMTARDAWWWDANVQPRLLLQPGRADRLWSWSTMLPACMYLQLRRGRRCRPLVVWAYADGGRLVRAAMSILIERYPHLDVRAPGDAYFIWFMSAAPDSVLASFGVSDPPSLGDTCIDNTLVLSANDGCAGRLGLHAAPSGGARLLGYYAARLLALPAAQPLPAPIRRRNDGRFFYADDARAALLLSRGDAFR